MRFARLKADRAVGRAKRQLKETAPDLVQDVFFYGAVDIDPKHLVVWVILKGDPDSLPEWFFLSDSEPDDEAAAKGLLPDMRHATSVVRDQLARVRWPDANLVRVGFDSDERVGRAGGWQYFK
jgi:hypothetical protein